MSAGGFSQYIIGGAKSSLKVLLTFDCNTDQIAQDHRDKFNRHCQDGYDVIYKIQGSKSMCLIANPHGDKTIPFGGLQLRNQQLIQNCIRSQKKNTLLAV